MTTECAWFSTFFEKAFVRRVKRRDPIRNVRAAAKLHLNWCAANKAEVMKLDTPDGIRKIIDSDLRFSGLALLSLEVDQLAEAVEADLRSSSFVTAQTLDKRLREAYIAA